VPGVNIFRLTESGLAGVDVETSIYDYWE